MSKLAIMQLIRIYMVEGIGNVHIYQCGECGEHSHQEEFNERMDPPVCCYCKRPEMVKQNNGGI